MTEKLSSLGKCGFDSENKFLGVVDRNKYLRSVLVSIGKINGSQGLFVRYRPRLLFSILPMVMLRIMGRYPSVYHKHQSDEHGLAVFVYHEHQSGQHGFAVSVYNEHQSDEHGLAVFVNDHSFVSAGR